jgi:hypothetical protein
MATATRTVHPASAGMARSRAADNPLTSVFEQHAGTSQGRDANAMVARLVACVAVGGRTTTDYMARS